MEESISQKDSLLTLDYLRFHPENQYLERKGIYDEKGLKPAKLANEIIGMLNAGGGILVFGISDSGEIQDLNNLDVDLLRQYRKAYYDFIKPPANIEIEELTLGSGELIFIYHVEKDCERLFCREDNEDVYLRVADSNKKLLRDQIRKLEYDKTIRKFEDEFREDFISEDLNSSILDFYKERINFKGNNDELLVRRNLAVQKNEKIFYRNSAILLFASDPDKYIPNAIVRYVRYDGIIAKTGTDHNVIKDERLQGPIPGLIETTKSFLYPSLRDYYYLDIKLGKFVKIAEYPEEAWLEGIVNALTHRSYNLQGNPVYIKHFDDRLEISNSGPLPAQVTIENIQTERYARNPRIARVLSDMGYVRELNEGVPRIYESMEKSMLAKPKYSDKNDTVTLVLKNKVSDHEMTISVDVMNKIEKKWNELNDTQRKMMQYFFEKHHATIGELSEKMNVSKQGLRLYLASFCDDDILERLSDKQRDINAIYAFKKS